MCLHAVPSAFGGPYPSPHYPPSLLLQPIHVNVGLSLDLATQSAKCSITTRVRANKAGARELTLDGVSLEDVSVSAPAPAAHHYDGQRITITWATPFVLGEEREVVTSYRVERPLSGLLFYKDPSGATIAAGTDHETERARYWLACVDHPSARPHMSFAIETDAAHTAVANGAHVGETIQDGRKITRWALDFPCPSYLVSLVAGDLIKVDGGMANDVTPVTFYSPRGLVNEEELVCSYSKTKNMIEWITKKLSLPLPWPKYAHYVFPGSLGGAMENISLVNFDPRFAVDARLRPERGWYLDSINLHELAHTFFGDSVVCRDFAHGWLKEGWATYMEWMYMQDHESIDMFNWFLFHQLGSYTAEGSQYHRPIVNNQYQVSFQLYDEHLYPGGAWRLRMLHRELGDAFWPAVTQYLTKFHQKTVETADFRRVLEESTGKSLVKFFENWLHKPGHPMLKISHSFDEAAGGLALTCEQTQHNGNSGIPLFDGDIDVLCESPNGEWLSSSISLSSTRAVSMASLPMTVCPLQILIDPHGHFCCTQEFNPGDTMLRRAAAHAPTTFARLHAVAALVRSPSRANIAFLGSLLVPTTFWGVRGAIYAALAPLGRPTTAAILVAALATEDEPRALKELFKAMGSHRFPVVADALRTFVATRADHVPQTVAGAALTALGAQGHAADVPTLVQHALAPYRIAPWTQIAAIEGLGQAHVEEAHTWLLSLLPDISVFSDGTLRSAVAHALGVSTTHLPEEKREPVREALARMCQREEDAGAALSAAEALGAIGVGSHIGAVRGIKAIMSNFHEARADAAIVHAASAPSSAAECDRLRLLVDTLTGRVDKLEAALEQAKIHIPQTAPLCF